MFTMIILVCSMKSMCIPGFVLICCCLSESLCPHHNVWPEAVYGCNYIVYQIVRVGMPNLIALYLRVSEIAKCIA